MKHFFSSIILLTTVACGTGAPLGSGKPAAASAAAALSTPTQTATQRALGASGMEAATLVNGCTRGGAVTLSNFAQEVDQREGTVVSQNFTMQLDDCALATTPSGDAKYSGTVQVTQRVYVNADRRDVSQTFKGRLTLAGAVDDFLDTDLTQTVALEDLGAARSVAAVFKGTVTNRSGTYSFDESVNITAGQLVSASSN